MKSWTIALNVFRRILHDFRTLMLVVLTPLLFIGLYGLTFSGTPKGLRVLVVNLDNGLASVRTEQLGRVTLEVKLAQKLIEGLDPEVVRVESLDDPEEARAQVERGEAWAALIFPIHFSHALINEIIARGGIQTIELEGRTLRVFPSPVAESPLVTAYVDDSNPLVAVTLTRTIEQAFTALIAQQQASALTPEGLLELHKIYGGQVRRLDYTAPGVIGFAITLITVMLTAISIVRERTSGTLARVLVAPVRPWEVSFGYLLAFVFIGLFQAAELLFASIYAFQVRFVGEPVWVGLIIVLYTLGLQGVATWISTVSRNEFQAVQLLLVLIIPSTMMSGVFWPVEAMPPEIQPFAWWIPLTYANSALREVMLRGRDVTAIASQLSVLAGFALLMLVLSVLAMRRQARRA